jgi:inorganic pyrophosphatase
MRFLREWFISAPSGRPRFDEIHTVDEVFAHARREIEHFFAIYKELEGRSPVRAGPREAHKAISDSRKKYLARRAAAQAHEESILREP